MASNRKLNEKQKAFCREYVVDFNATQASIRAGYSAKTASSIGEIHLRKSEIQSEIARLQAERNKRTNVDADKIIKHLDAIAHTPITEVISVSRETVKKNGTEYEVERVQILPTEEWSDRAKIAVESIRQSKDGGIAIKMKDSIKAADMLGRHVGMWREMDVIVAIKVLVENGMLPERLVEFVNTQFSAATMAIAQELNPDTPKEDAAA